MDIILQLLIYIYIVYITPPKLLIYIYIVPVYNQCISPPKVVSLIPKHRKVYFIESVSNLWQVHVLIIICNLCFTINVVCIFVITLYSIDIKGKVYQSLTRTTPNYTSFWQY